MRIQTRFPGLVFMVALLAPGLALSPPARAAANHVVISEFATRGPSSATDEFVELYNPTNSPIDLAGWKLQYSSSTNGATWSDRAVLPANSIIAAHGFFLIANNTYTTGAAPDYTSSLWGSGQGMADNGHERIIDASAVEVDKVGWGSAVNPEGTAAPNHGTSANGNSVERKALSTSTADSLAAGGRHEFLGNGQDTDNNGADFVTQTHGRNPQNTSSAIEPSFSSGGNGTGSASIAPDVVYSDRDLASLTLSFSQDSSYTIRDIAILVPSDWTWSHLAGSVGLSGPAFASATPSVVADTIFISGAALTTSDAGTLTLSDLVTPSNSGGSIFSVRTAIASGTLTQILQQPSVRVLTLVPIVVVHVNDATGVPVAPYAIGSEATVTGTVTAILSDVRTDIYLQDDTAGIDLFSFDLPPFTINIGDSLTVTGSILQFRGLTELQPDFSLVTVEATGRPVPEPLVLTCADVNATFHPDYTEPNEGRLVRINGVSYNAVTSTITDASGTTNVFIPNTYPPAPSVFDLIGILKQYKPGTPAPGPPYTGDYEISPRTPDDIIPHPGPVILTTPFEDQIQPTSVRIQWTTDVPSTSVVRFGTTSALGDSVVSLTAVTQHAITVPDLTAATVYHYSAGSADVDGANFAPISVFSTASPPATSGTMNAYFNKSVDTSLAWLHTANGNEDLTARLVTRLNAAQVSIDAVFYNLSGTPGSTLASALVAAKNRGVKVRVICEYDNRTNAPYNTIAAAGITVITDRFDAVNNGLGLMHDKFVVIDGRGGAADAAWVWTGSWNPTDPGTYDDLQNSIEIQDQALAKVYTLEVDEMWGSSTDTPNAAASRFGARKLDDTPHRFVIGGHDAECYFSPSDGTTSHIISTIGKAQSSLGFELLTITRSDVADALIARHLAGVAVRGDMDNSSDTGSQYSYMVSNGLDVRLKTGVSGLLHHKYLLVDAENPAGDPIVLTGSHNWSSAAETNNSENTFIVHDPDVANQYFQEFAARYHQFGGTDILVVLGVEPVAGGVPLALALEQNAPNPFHGGTAIAYAIPTRGRVLVELYDVQGRKVQTLLDETQRPGRYRLELKSRGLAAGMYFYRLQAGGAVLQHKMLLLK